MSAGLFGTLSVLAANDLAVAGPTDAKADSKPDVKVTYIGLHVGGGPNDAATKAPFVKAIALKTEDLRSCYRSFVASRAKGTFGIDLLIAAAGGHAQTSNVRTALGSGDFAQCAERAFQSVEFEKPKRGATKISYSVRFEPVPQVP